MIEKYYKTINILRYFEGGFDTPAEYKNVGVFKGLIQAPSNSRTYNNSKDTSNVAVKVNYKPTKTIGENNILYYDCNSDNKTPNTSKPLTAGGEYFIDEHPYVYVQWTYPSDTDSFTS